MLNDSKSEPVTSGNSLNIIEIISPRRTLLLSTALTIRWNEVPDASYYIVSLINGSETCWQQKVSETEIVYPSNPPLKTGVLYSLAIKSDNNFSSERDIDKPELKFKLLDLISAQRVESRIEQIRKLKLAPEVEALALTTLYVEYGLNAKAIETLEKLVVNGTQVSVVYRTLSELYQYIGLNVLSEACSKTAIELESTSNAMESDRLEQEVIKVLEQQAATNTPQEQERVNLLERDTSVEAVAIESQQFLLCAVGQPCTTSTQQSGTWAYSPRSGCYCRRNSGG